MFAFRLRAAAVALAAGIGLSACTTPFGYNGVSVGLGNAGYYDPYYEGYGYPGYGYGYGYPRYGSGYGYGFDPYWGWNDGFYYPGTGFYVYDRYRNPYRWTDAQRRYWELRRRQALNTGTTTNPVVVRDNWDDFDGKRDGFGPVRRKVQRQQQVETSVDQPASVQRTDRAVRAERSQQRIERQQQRAERIQQQRAERSAARAERSSERAERSSARVERKSEARIERTNRASVRSGGVEREQ